MKKQILIFTAVVCGMTCTTTAYAQFKIGGKKINVGKVVQAGTDAAKAITLSDADIAAMSREYMQWMDTHNPLTKPDIKKRETTEWIKNVAASYGKRLGEIAYIFCSDEKILEVNRQYLQHDYYTDIITFDYCEGDRLSGDLFISLDTIRTNAEQFGASYDNELHRVIIHGILHLCGINDKGPGEREIMEAAENKALAMRQV